MGLHILWHEERVDEGGDQGCDTAVLYALVVRGKSMGCDYDKGIEEQRRYEEFCTLVSTVSKEQVAFLPEKVPLVSS